MQEGLETVTGLMMPRRFKIRPRMLGVDLTALSPTNKDAYSSKRENLGKCRNQRQMKIRVGKMRQSQI